MKKQILSEQTLRMQLLAGIITESQYKEFGRTQDVEESTFEIKDRDRGDSLLNLSTQLSQTLYDDLANKDTPDNPALIISKWGVKLKQATDLDDNQISDLTKDAISLRGMDKGSRYKQVMRDKIYKSLKGDQIR
jgi:hypothetical protein